MHIIVFITASGKIEANRIARALVQNKLAACVNIVGSIRSVFRWQGKIDQAKETLLMVKSHKGKLARIIRCVKSLHSYEVPEIIALPIIAGDRAYLKWIDESLRNPS